MYNHVYRFHPQYLRINSQKASQNSCFSFSKVTLLLLSISRKTYIIKKMWKESIVKSYILGFLFFYFFKIREIITLWNHLLFCDMIPIHLLLKKKKVDKITLNFVTSQIKLCLAWMANYTTKNACQLLKKKKRIILVEKW